MNATEQERRDVATEMSMAIQNYLRSPELKDLPSQNLEKIARAVFLDNLKEQFRREVKKSQIDVEKLRKKWLRSFESVATQRSFGHNLDLFFSWFDGQSILDVDAKVVDDYIHYLKADAKTGKGKHLSSATIRQRIAACSSFWKKLVRWGDAEKNPFLGTSNLPRKVIARKTAKEIPSDEQLDRLETYCAKVMKKKSGKNYAESVEAARKAFGALMVLRATGFRSDALPNLVLEENGDYRTQSKGSVHYGRLPTAVIEKLKELKLAGKQPFSNYRYFNKWLQRACKKFEFKFSVHGIRHRFSVNHYQEHKDIVLLQRALGHKSTNATDAYLSSLGLR